MTRQYIRSYIEQQTLSMSLYLNSVRFDLSSEEELKSFVKRNYYQLAGQIFSFDGILLYGEDVTSSVGVHTEDQKTKVKQENSRLILELEDEEVLLKPVTIGQKILKEDAQLFIDSPEKSDNKEVHKAVF